MNVIASCRLAVVVAALGSSHHTFASVIVPVSVDHTVDTNTSPNTSTTQVVRDCPLHNQIFLSAAAIGLEPGVQIVGLAWRPDAGSSSFNSWPAADFVIPQYNVKLAKTTRTINTMSGAFASNLLNPVLVRSGSLTIPAGLFTGTAAPNPFQTVVTFSTPYTYTGGDLIIDIVASGSCTGGISVDAISQFPLNGVKSLVANSATATAGTFAEAPLTKLILAEPTTPSAHDTCINAKSIAHGQYAVFSTGASGTDGQATCGTSTKDVWYSFVAPADGRAVFVVNMEESWPVLTVYNGSCAGGVLGCTAADQGQAALDIPVAQGQTLILRIAGSTAHTPSSGWGLLNASLVAPNDACEHAVDITTGLYSFSTEYATADLAAFCESGAMRSLWYRYTAPADTVDRVEFELRSDGYQNFGIVMFDQCDGTRISSEGSISCVYSSSVTSPGGVAYLAAGEQVLVGVGQSSVIDAGFTVLATPVSAWFETDDGGGDSGENIEYSQYITVDGPLDRLIGRSNAYNEQDVDVYKIQICDSEFSASSAIAPSFPGSSTNVSMQLLGLNGEVVVPGNHIILGSVPPGEYYLSVSSSTSSGYLAYYRIALTGVCGTLASPPCAADFNHVNGVTVQDIFDFLTAWLAGNPSANFNNVNGVTVQDIFDFLTAWLAGC